MEIDRGAYPEPVRRAADLLAEMYEEGAVFPARMRFNSDGEQIPESEMPPGSFAFMIPDVVGIRPSERTEEWPWNVFADTAIQAYRAQVSDEI